MLKLIFNVNALHMQESDQLFFSLAYILYVC